MTHPGKYHGHRKNLGLSLLLLFVELVHAKEEVVDVFVDRNGFKDTAPEGLLCRAFFLSGLEAFLEDGALVVLMFVWAWAGLIGSTDLCGFVLAAFSVQMLVCSFFLKEVEHTFQPPGFLRSRTISSS